MAKLPSIFNEEDEQEIFHIQKEPRKIVNPVNEMPPAIDMQQVVANVQTQEQCEQEGMPQQQVETLIHPNEDDAPLPQQTQMQGEGQQDCQMITPVVYIHQPMDALSRVYDLTTPEGMQKYTDFTVNAPQDITSAMQMTSQCTVTGHGFKIMYGQCYTDRQGTNLDICTIEFLPRKLIQLEEKESKNIINRYVVDDSRTIFEETRIGEEQLEVFYNRDALLGKSYSTLEILEYFKKIFILLSIDKELEFFIGERHQPGYARRSNFAQPQLWWSEKIMSTDNIFAMGDVKRFDQYETIYTHTVNISRLTANMEINGKRVYFQVICTERDVYIITNFFYGHAVLEPVEDRGRSRSRTRGKSKKEPLPPERTLVDKHVQPAVPSAEDRPFDFEYVTKIEPKTLNEWLEEEPYYYEAKEKEIVPSRYRVYNETIGRYKKRKTIEEKVCRCWKVIDLKFLFIYPVALLEYVHKPGSDEGIVMPAYFLGNHEHLTFDPKIILTNDWQILHSFIKTVLFPEQYAWPKPIGVDETVDEQYIDQPAEPLAIQPANQPFGQLAEQAALGQDIEARVDDVFERPLLEQLREQQGEEVPDAVADAQMALMQMNYEEARRRREEEQQGFRVQEDMSEFSAEEDRGFLNPYPSQ